MIILMGGEKGGPGKSTTACNLLGWLRWKTSSVLAFDADPQRSISDWCDDRDDAGLPYIPCVQKTGRINKSLLEMNENYKYVVCDIGGRDSSELRSGLIVADICIFPFKCSQFDLNTCEKMLDLVKSGMDLNPKLKIFSYLNMCSTNPKVKEAEDSIHLFDDFPELNIMRNCCVGDRKVFRDVLPEGKSVFEAENEKAVREMASVFDALNII